MTLSFFKYQGAGNDFIIIDNRHQQYQLSRDQINWLCDRHFGIGADGLMLLQLHEGVDFEMVYFNADGKESTMCGNGGRCIAAFAYDINLVESTMRFVAIDGLHEATILADNEVSLLMQDVDEIQFVDDTTVIMNTGSPHYVKWAQNIHQIDVVQAGRNIRNQVQFAPNGINVNFAERMNEYISVRTYERGVEDETLACGTGVTAVAIASTLDRTGMFEIPVKALGGNLKVSFTKSTFNAAHQVMLQGPAKKVFEGRVAI